MNFGKVFFDMKKSIKENISIIGFPIDLGSGRRGVDMGPSALRIAGLQNKLKNLGYKVAIISRGYRGAASKVGGIVSDGQTVFMEYDQAGDEPLMMASALENIPVAVGQNRVETGLQVIKRFNPDVIVLDDAFQHLKLIRDIDLVLLDYCHPFGNNHLLPRGTLREKSSALFRADAIILSRSETDFTSPVVDEKGHVEDKPVFHTTHKPYIHSVIKEKTKEPCFPTKADFEFLKGRRVFIFSGIASNKDFRKTVEDFKCDIVGVLEFSDHYQYIRNDMNKISRMTMELDADFILTTEKDYVRIAQNFTFPVQLVVIGIDIVFTENGEDAFKHFVKTRLF